MTEIDPEADEKFAGDTPFEIVTRWMAEARETEPNDPNAIALATVDADGMPNVRMVLLKDIESDGFVFYTNYDSVKSRECVTSGTAAFVLHWKSLRRQVRVRGTIERETGQKADEYYKSRSLGSRLGAWASDQSKPLGSRAELISKVETVRTEKGEDPPRPPFWGGYRITPSEIEFWADGADRLHDRFRWTRKSREGGREVKWAVSRLYP